MREDLELLQGTWSVSALAVDGQIMPEEMLTNARVVVKGGRFTSEGMGAVYKGTIELDTSTKPRQINMRFDAGPEKGNTNLGIYKLDGDTWKLCLATRGTIRPSRFASTPGSGFGLETLTRGERVAAKKTKARSGKKATTSHSIMTAATEFEGEWRMVSGVMDGSPMEKSVVQWVKRVTAGNETTVYAGPQVLMKMSFTSDASKSPKTIEYVHTAGSNKGKTQQGIYEFVGDLMRICVAAPGAARPEEFQSTPGDGATFTEWKRV